MSASRKQRVAAPRASFAEHDDDDDLMQSAVDADADELELVAGGPGGGKRKKPSSSGRPVGRPRGSSGKPPASKKPRRSLVSDDERDDDDDDDEGDDPPASSSNGTGDDAAAADAKRVRAIAARARASAAVASATSLGAMSQVASAAHATHLSYFDQLAAPAKSKNTLQDVAKLTAEQRASIAAALPVRHADAKARLMACHRSAMREWYLQLRAGGFNLLAYGFGSKKSLLSEFARTWLTDGPVVVLNGYYPGANVKNLLTTFTRELMSLPASQTFRDTHAHVEFIREWFRNDARMASGGRRGRSSALAVTDEADHEDAMVDEKLAASAVASAATAFLPRVYLLVHNIDGASLRSESQQQVLALLASIPQVHLIASVDHILSGWLWDQTALNHFNFVHHDCTTYASYEKEFLFATSDASSARAGEGALLDTSQSGRAGGIVNVLTSLTPNHRKVLDVLAREQLTVGNPNFLPSTALVLRSAFLSACEDNMLVANAAAFDRLIAELKDHHLIEEKVVLKTRVVCIPYSAVVIRRHILGESADDPAVVEAAAAAEREAQDQDKSEANERNAFAQAIGEPEEGEEDDGIAAAAEEAQDDDEDED